MLTIDSFTRDFCKNILRLFNISISSSASCPEAMSKRMRRWIWSCISRQALLQRRVRVHLFDRGNSEHKAQGNLAAGGSNQNDVTSSSQVWLTGSKMNERAGKLATAGTNQDPSIQVLRKLAAENSDINDEDDMKWAHNYRTSPAHVPHFETCYTNSTASQKTKWRTWMWIRWYVKYLWMSLSKPQYILEKIFEDSTCYQNQPQRTVKHLFDVTRKLVRDQTEIQGISLIIWQEHSWKRTTLLNHRAVRLSKAKAHVFSDSVSCMRRISACTESAWKEKFDLFLNQFTSMSRIGSNRRRANGNRVEKFPRMHNITDSRWDSESDDWNAMWTCSQFQSSIILKSMYNDIVWAKKENKESCIVNSW